MARFTLPRDLYHGKGALEALKTFKGKKAIICVGGGSMKRFGFLQKAEDYLKEAGMEVKLFEGIEPDPSVETVMKGAAVMQEFEPDWIVAMGGGSPIDAAKAMWIKYEYPDITLRICAKYLVFRRCATRHISVQFHQLPELQQKLLRFPSLQIMRRESSIRLRILRLHQMLQS